ncbi:hypothetical protein EDD18DRAFT_1078784 [Armillaria luteobubalina]|uniref:Uncharacterized protein n=1 Tax=Armillaria luteobubalina TaxID=153913 RepID=A0AA39PZI2_9AGAR|nr:hypothetical protein EDD18DRAFT_1078784 [Armillaria luteobubalina]
MCIYLPLSQVNNLAHHTGAHFVRFMLCSNIHDTFQPALVTDLSASMKFFERVVGVPTEDILVKFKQFFCAKSLSESSFLLFYMSFSC